MSNTPISTSEHHDTNSNMETAIELPEARGRGRRREREGLIGRIIAAVEMWCLAVTSETALAFYVLLHWLIGCASHIVLSADQKTSPSGDDNSSFFSFVYFMSTLVAFLSLMSHVSGLLIPLFTFSITGALFLLILVNLGTLDNPDSQELFRSICMKSNTTQAYLEMMETSPTGTIVKTWLLIVFFSLTCIAILFQFARNEEYLRRPQPMFHPGFYPHMVHHHREMPVGPANLDEPPRYSTLEPLASSPPKPLSSTVTHSSTVTSPPRYSYWERTFGRRGRTVSQCSEQSSFGQMHTAKSH